MIQPLIAAALLLAQAAPVERPCITHEEAGDMAVALLPFLVDAAAQRCRPHLAADSFLVTGAAEWSARLRHDGAPRRASALRGIGKMGGATPPAGAGGEAAFDFLAQLATGSLTTGIRPENCSQLDAIAESLAPLPTENLARLVSAGLSLAMTANQDDDQAEAADEQEEGADGTNQEAAAATDHDGPPICRS